MGPKGGKGVRFEMRRRYTDEERRVREKARRQEGVCVWCGGRGGIQSDRETEWGGESDRKDI